MWPYNGVNALGSKTTPAATTQHENTDGKKLMNISISDMAIAEDKTASFKFINYNVASSQEGYIIHETFDKCQGTGGNDGSFGEKTCADKEGRQFFTHSAVVENINQ